MSWLSKLLELKPAGLNWPRGVLFLDVILAPLVVFWAIGHEEYLLAALFGALFAVLADPGGGYWYAFAHRRLRADRRGGDRAGVWHRRGRLGLARARGVHRHADGRPGGHVRGAPVRRGPAGAPGPASAGRGDPR